MVQVYVHVGCLALFCLLCGCLGSCMVLVLLLLWVLLLLLLLLLLLWLLLLLQLLLLQLLLLLLLQLFLLLLTLLLVCRWFGGLPVCFVPLTSLCTVLCEDGGGLGQLLGPVKFEASGSCEGRR